MSSRKRQRRSEPWISWHREPSTRCGRKSGLGGESAVIKSHHNVGGLPDYVDFKEIIEPLRNLFKDEVRKAGLELGIPEKLVFRQPFPDRDLVSVLSVR